MDNPYEALVNVPIMFSAKATSLPSSELAYTNKLYIPEQAYRALMSQYRTEPVLVELGHFILTVLPSSKLSDSIGMSKFVREMARVSLVDSLSVKLFNPPDEFILGSVNLDIELIGKRAKKLEIPEETLEEKFRESMADMVLNMNQKLLMDYEGTPLVLTVSQLRLVDLTLPGPKDQLSACTQGLLHSQTSVDFSSISHSTLEITSSKVKTINIFDGPKFNFEELGIGGLDNEFSVIFRRAFASRLFPPQVMHRLGIIHVKGMLLHGPPGTGKTLIARQIAKCLRAKEPKIVNGPELFNKYVGQTEENIRELFKDAEKDQEAKGDTSQLHIIIIDELDSICKPRGTIQGGTGVHDTAVNQLLSKIDGVNSLNNILIIGMTNRKDMIDEAVLRPGRLEVHVEIGLPDESGRQQILRIHTKSMRNNGVLSGDVDLDEIARITKNFSGAEIESLVKSAASYAFNKEIDLENLGREIDVESIRVGSEEFRAAFADVQPQFGMDTQDLTRYIRGGMIDYGESFSQLWSTCQMLMSQIKNSKQTHLLSILLEGPEGSGKTALAAKLAIESGFPYVKLVSPENYVGYTESGKVTHIAKVFEDAYRSSLSLVVLDNIERLIDFVSIGPRFSNAVLQTILVLTKKPPPHDNRKILIIGTTSNAALLEDLDLVHSFNVVLEVKKLSGEGIAKLLRKFKVKKEVRNDIARQAGAVPVKKMLLALEMASQLHAEITAEAFLDCLQSISFK